MIKNKILLTLIIFIITISCDHKKNNRNNDHNSFKSIKFTELRNENNEIVEIKIKNINFPISIVYFKESEKTFILFNNDESQFVELDWKRNEDLTLNTSEIYLFTRDKSFYFILPIFSEEFPTFQMFEFSEKGKIKDLGSHTFNYVDVEKMKNELCCSLYFLKEKDNIIRIYAGTKSDILLSKIEFRPITSVKLTNSEKKQIESLRASNNKNENSNWVGNYQAFIESFRESKEYILKYSFDIKDTENIVLIVEINNVPSENEILYIESISNSEIKLKSRIDKNIEYIISKKNNSFYLSGLSAYIINPPNNNYKLKRVLP